MTPGLSSTTPQRAAGAVQSFLSYLGTAMRDAGIDPASATGWCYRRHVDFDTIRTTDNGTQLQWCGTIEMYGLARYHRGPVLPGCPAWSLFPECGPVLPGLSFPVGAHAQITEAVAPFIDTLAGLGLPWLECGWIFPSGYAAAYDGHSGGEHSPWQPSFHLHEALQFLTPEGVLLPVPDVQDH